jgi:transcriptional regulator with XRE-family HTH domain
MVNTEDFIKRLEIILDYYSINASSFADKIGVQRSSLSHLLSGRNKPSLDFILKILEVYPEVDLYWILNGKGNFPKTTDNSSQEAINVEHKTTVPFTAPKVEPESVQDLFTDNNSIAQEAGQSDSSNKLNHLLNETIAGDIEKIVFFYNDGTFKVFNSK